MLLTTSVTVFTSNLACLNQLTADWLRLRVLLVSAMVSRVMMRPRLSLAGLGTITHWLTQASSSLTLCSMGVTTTCSSVSSLTKSEQRPVTVRKPSSSMKPVSLILSQCSSVISSWNIKILTTAPEHVNTVKYVLSRAKNVNVLANINVRIRISIEDWHQSAYLGLIISIEITHKNISSESTHFSAPPASSTSCSSTTSILSSFLCLQLHLNPGSCFTHCGKFAKPTKQFVSYSGRRCLVCITNVDLIWSREYILIKIKIFRSSGVFVLSASTMNQSIFKTVLIVWSAPDLTCVRKSQVKGHKES